MSSKKKNLIPVQSVIYKGVVWGGGVSRRVRQDNGSRERKIKYNKFLSGDMHTPKTMISYK